MPKWPGRTTQGPAWTVAEPNREVARRAAEGPVAARQGNHADRDPCTQLPLSAKDARAQTDGNAQVPPSTAWHRCLTVQLSA